MLRCTHCSYPRPVLGEEVEPSRWVRQVKLHSMGQVQYTKKRDTRRKGVVWKVHSTNVKALNVRYKAPASCTEVEGIPPSCLTQSAMSSRFEGCREGVPTADDEKKFVEDYFSRYRCVGG